MSTFEQKLTFAVERFKSLQADDGGWTERRRKGYKTSIVNTVEVLAIMRAAGVPYSDSAVQRGTRYLTAAVEQHPRPLPEGRGPATRYCAWGLSGLTLYKESRHDPHLCEAQECCVAWLKKWRLAGGAWGEGPTDDHPSLVSTSAAISGLARVCPYAPFGDESAELLKEARKVIRDLALKTSGRGPKTYWPLRVGDQRASPAATAMAVISLAGGSEEDRAMAARGGEWLRDHADKWQNHVEAGGAIHPYWRHMSFSLALRAVIRTAREPSTGELKRVLTYLDALWIDEQDLWARGRPDGESSTSGAYAVVAAYEAVANARRFDPDKEILRQKADGGERVAKARGHLVVYSKHATLVSDIDGSTITVELRVSERALLALLVRRSADGREGDSLEEISWGMGDLVNLLEQVAGRRLKVATIERYIREINHKFTAAARTEHKVIESVIRTEEDLVSPGTLRATVNVNHAEALDVLWPGEAGG